MSRLAAVDVGTNSVLLLVAERGADGVVRPVREEADITRLGRGVDRTGVLSTEGMQATLDVLARFAALARYGRGAGAGRHRHLRGAGRAERVGVHGPRPRAHRGEGGDPHR